MTRPIRFLTVPGLVLLLAGCSNGDANEESQPQEPPQHVSAVGGGPVFQMLPSEAVYRDRVPEEMRAKLPSDPTPFGNEVALISGTIRVEATDRSDDPLPDLPYTSDEAMVTAEFQTEDGAEWRVVQTRVAARLEDGSPRLFAGVGIGQVVHGDTGRENPLMPKMAATLTMWGFADVFKNGDLVKHDALLHIMVTSRARDLEDGHYLGYDVTPEPVEEIHLFLNPGNQLPAPGGFLHVNWERSTVDG